MLEFFRRNKKIQRFFLFYNPLTYSSSLTSPSFLPSFLKLFLQKSQKKVFSTPGADRRKCIFFEIAVVSI